MKADSKEHLNIRTFVGNRHIDYIGKEQIFNQNRL